MQQIILLYFAPQNKPTFATASKILTRYNNSFCFAKWHTIYIYTAYKNKKNNKNYEPGADFFANTGLAISGKREWAPANRATFWESDTPGSKSKSSSCPKSKSEDKKLMFCSHI